MELQFEEVIWHWRGPSPYHFVTVPEDESHLLAEIAPEVSYGWGMIPVSAQIGATRFTTSLFPKDGGYIVPLKDAVRKAESIEAGDVIMIALTVET